MPLPETQLHAVSLYHDADSLGRTVARFLEEGFDLGEPALVVASDSHARAITRAFRGSPALPVSWLDSRTTLDAISVGDEPDPERFRAVVGAELDRARSSFPRVRVYGEMVDLLWEAGRLDAALRLEALWTDFQASRPFSLLCGYGMDVFDRALPASAVASACGCHTGSSFSRDPKRIQEAVDGALDAALGIGRAADLRTLIDGTRTAERPPGGRGERAAQWLRRPLSARAPGTLADARRRYEEAPPSDLSIPAPAPPERGCRVLYAEDDPDDAFFMRRAVAKSGADITLEVAPDGAEAQARLEQGDLPDLVLLDLKMPRKNGDEVLSWMRSRPVLESLPVAVLTSSTERNDVERVYRAGADLYLAKPQGSADLTALLRGLMVWVSELRAR